MAPILATRGAGSATAFGRLFTAPVIGDFDSIATVSSTGSVKTLTFSNIPQTYKHLQIRGVYQYGAADNIEMTINGGTAVTRSYWLRGDSASMYAAEVTSNTIAPQSGASTTDMYGIILDFIDYSDTNKYKTIRNFGGVDRNGSGTVWFISITYGTTSAITSITLQNPTHVFVNNSSFALYGIKG